MRSRPSAISRALVGITALIGDDRDFIAIDGEAKHGVGEIAAERAVNPRGADVAELSQASRTALSPASFDAP